ncbi:MAG: aminotransferase class I/II-fold pyridoxal phosphate-dependent enzyme [Candidatus Jorgensenbacteria bacterium]|nr:aminotransferase class I/II-fold pyridoxal phosphate-dependent enzyme [Candidatus Jorgensenbacteria bacterium]
MNPLIKDKKFVPSKDWVWYAPNTTDAFGENEIQAVMASLKSGWLTTGKITREFENKIAGLFGKKYGLFVNSGSSANLLALEALKFPKGSEVITPACNFNTTVAPIIQTGLRPVFVDVGLGTYVIDADSLEKALSKKTVAVFAPHLIGNFVDLPKIRAFCKKHKLVFIEDSCDTIGGNFHGEPSGKFSDITTTSFYASHLITTGGAGGMLMTNDKKIRERARLFRDWGRGISRHDEKIRSRLATFKIDGKPYDSAFVFVEHGYNFKPTEMQAAFGLEQLSRLPGFTELRRCNFSYLRNFFKKFEKFFILPEEKPNTITNWLAFPLTIKKGAPFKRNALVKYLEDNKIQTRPLFSGNILKQPAYLAVSHNRIGNLENSQHILENSFLIGLHHGLTQLMLEYVADTFEKFLKKQ